MGGVKIDRGPLLDHVLKYIHAATAGCVPPTSRELSEIRSSFACTPRIIPLNAIPAQVCGSISFPCPILTLYNCPVRILHFYVYFVSQFQCWKHPTTKRPLLFSTSPCLHCALTTPPSNPTANENSEFARLTSSRGVFGRLLGATATPGSQYHSKRTFVRLSGGLITPGTKHRASAARRSQPRRKSTRRLSNKPCPSSPSFEEADRKPRSTPKNKPRKTGMETQSQPTSTYPPMQQLMPSPARRRPGARTTSRGS